MSPDVPNSRVLLLTVACIAALVGLFARIALGQQANPPTFVERSRVVAAEATSPLITRLPPYPAAKRYVAPAGYGQASSAATELRWHGQSASNERPPIRQAAAEAPLQSDRGQDVQPAINLVPADAYSLRWHDSADAPAPPQQDTGPAARTAVQTVRPRVAPSRADDVSPIPPAFVFGDDNLQADEPAAPPLDPLPALGGIDGLDELPPAVAPRPAKPCPDVYRDSNCCEERDACHAAWRQTQSDPVRGFRKDFLDITPLFKPDVSYRAISDADQNRFRQEGLSLTALRNWRASDGRVLMVAGGEVFGLDDKPIPDGARPLNAFVQSYNADAGEVTVKTAEPEATFTLPLDKLSRDDQFWVQGRPWRNLDGRVIATGRFENFKWGRIYIRTRDGRIVEVPLTHLGADELCYVDAYWGDGIGLPPECRLAGELQIRDFTLLTFTWKASALCHKPLYFEEVQLERYGHSAGPIAQPVISGAHFFANIAILPYKMGIHPPTECVYALGYYRPGSCAPYMIPPVPFSVRGGLFQAGAVVGASAILP